jgi:hypothetical protein
MGNYKRSLDLNWLCCLLRRHWFKFQRLWRYFIAENRGFYAVLLLLCFGLAGCSDGQSSSPFASANRMSAPGSIPPLERNELQKSAAAEALRAIAPPQGIKYTKLFTEPLASPDDRLARLENAVQMMRDDLDTALPTVVRLAAVESDMKDLIAQLESFTAADDMLTGADVPNAAMVNDVVTEALDEVSPPADAGTPPPLSADPAQAPADKTASVDALADALNDVSGEGENAVKKTPPPLPMTPEKMNTPASADKPAVQMAQNAPPKIDAAETASSRAPPEKAAVDKTDSVMAPLDITPPENTQAQNQAPRDGVLSVSGVAVKDMGDQSMIGLLVSADLSYKPSVIDDGFRVVIDIPAPAEFTGKEFTAPFSNSALMSGYAVEKRADGGLSIVYEALSPVTITKHSLVKAVQNDGYIVQVEVKAK